MANLRNLSAALLIVLATELCSKADYEGLRTLQQRRPDVLGADLCCRILLTFVSGNEQPAQYVSLLRQLHGITAEAGPEDVVDLSHIQGLSEADARRMIRQMHLQRLEKIGDSADGGDLISSFVLHQAYRIDAETGDLPAILQLVEPFIHQSELLRRWLISNLLPLLRLDYEYYSEAASGLSLDALRNLEGITGLDALLQKAKGRDGKTNIGRDLRGIVGPWMCGASFGKRRRLNQKFRRASIDGPGETSSFEVSGWQDVNEWILHTTTDDHDLTARIIADWNGPTDIDLGGYEGPAQPPPDGNMLTLRYGQAALASIFAIDDPSPTVNGTSQRILDRVAEIVQIEPPRGHHLDTLPDLSAQPDNIASMQRTALSLGSFLESGHPLTWPSMESLSFAAAILRSLLVLRNDLHSQQHPSCRNATNLCLFATEQEQRQELHKTLQHLARTASSGVDWCSVREQTLWLSRWTTQHQDNEQHRRAMFWRVPLEGVETEILRAMLIAKQYRTAIAVYLANPGASPLPPALVENLVEGEIMNAYDNASNGNRTRGGLRRASEILQAFGPHFPPSSPVNRIEHLLAATHSLSFYHLTLQHGVPFQPVSIRVHHDPISLIGKVLEQNANAYTKLDDLLSIGRGLVAAALPSTALNEDEPGTPAAEESLETQMLRSDHRITYDAIISALSSNDFDTAYSYILTRLSPSSQPTSPSSPIDDTSWRAAYAAGRHRPPSSFPSSRPAQIGLLTKKLDLLSLSLTLVPDPALLPSMLATWQRCSDEVDALRAQESAEEKAWDDRGDKIHSAVPGGFGLDDSEGDMAETQRAMEKRRAAKSQVGRYNHDEAPVGLFDMARGAARAIGKTAFPARAAAGAQDGVRVSEMEAESRASAESARSTGGSGSGEEGAQRLRKRDMVSNMVTGGLVSGLGWVLGAQPVDQEGVGGQRSGD